MKNVPKQKHKLTEEDFARDPSLKYCPYRWMELLYCVDGMVRFVSYNDDGQEVVLAEQDSMRILPGTYPTSSVRRL
jgi:uncharacterized cupin superfamily protein